MSSDPVKPNRGRPKTLNKDHVATVAMNAYWEDGPSDVSLNEICYRAGVSKPSVYREFGNDDGLAASALETYAATVLSEMQAIVVGRDTFAEKIRKLVYLSAVGTLHKNGCLFIKMRSVKAQMGPKTQAVIDQIETHTSDAFAGLLAEARASGEWSSNIPTDLAADYLKAQIGLALDHRARGVNPKPVLDMALSVLTDPKP